VQEVETLMIFEPSCSSKAMVGSDELHRLGSVVVVVGPFWLRRHRLIKYPQLASLQFLQVLKIEPTDTFSHHQPKIKSERRHSEAKTNHLMMAAPDTGLVCSISPFEGLISVNSSG
jgi:hypothetical protein